MAGIASIDKLLAQIEKAQDTILNACDVLDSCIAIATEAGGQVAQIVPSHIQTCIDRLTGIVESEDASSLSKIDDLVSNMPIRAVKSQSPSERRAASAKKVDLNPNTGSGPQSAIAAKESVSWRDLGHEVLQETGGLSWDKLQESEDFQHNEDDLTSHLIEKNNPIDAFTYRGKIREAINDNAKEDLESLQEGDDEVSTRRLEEFDISRMVGITGSHEGMPSFNTLREGNNSLSFVDD